MQQLTILGIETSCDETGVAVVRLTPWVANCPPRSSAPAAGPVGAAQAAPRERLAQGQVLGEALHSQVALHAAYGGVVPELASRDHVLRLLPLTQRALDQSGLQMTQIDAIAFTEGPGLAGALLVGASVAQGLAAGLNKPVIGIHHLEGHLLSPLLGAEQEGPDFPFLALLVSGGHTQLMQVNAVGSYQLLGETIDDAAGEAFDKSAQLLGLGYPGGPEIGKWALQGDPKRFDLPRPLLKRPTLDFSFAGLKTAVLTQVQKCQAQGPLTDQIKSDMAASVQAAIVEVLVNKCERAMTDTGLTDLVIAGGVGANLELRRQLNRLEEKRGARIFFPPPSLCTDNGVMIAWAAGLRILAGAATTPAGSFSVRPRWPLSA
jgi:N6-L-threonylcarbamoyladenine synthase